MNVPREHAVAAILEAYEDGDERRWSVAFRRLEHHRRGRYREQAVERQAVAGAAVAVDRVAIVADLARIADAVATGRTAVGGTAVARAVVAVVADLTWIEPAVPAGPCDTDPLGTGHIPGVHALQPRRAQAAIVAARRCGAQATSLKREHPQR